LLGAGADVNFWSEECGCPLSSAAFVGESEAAQLLLDMGADVNQSGGHWDCPLGEAAAVGHTKTMSLLINAGADVNLGGMKYGSPLGVAAYNGQLTAAKALLDAGADVNSRGGNYGSPLGVAAFGKSVAVVKFLLAHGASVFLRGGDHAQTQLAGARSNRGIIVSLDLACSFDFGADGFQLNAAISSAVARPYEENRQILHLLLREWAALSMGRRSGAARLCGEVATSLVKANPARTARPSISPAPPKPVTTS
jgi:ankyrin repeat protein